MDNNRPIRVRRDLLQVRSPDFSVDLIVLAENFSILSPIGRLQAVWLQLQLSDTTWLQSHMTHDLEYQHYYRSRRVHVWYSPQPTTHTILYVNMDDCRIADVHKVVVGWVALKAVLVTLKQEARPRHRDFARLTQAQRMDAVAEIAGEANLQEPERGLLLSFLATRQGLQYLGIEDRTAPSIPGFPQPPADAQDPNQGGGQENLDPNAGSGPYQEE